MNIVYLSFLASGINLLAWVIYLSKQWSGAITSSPIGWGLSALMVLSGFFSLWESGNLLIGLSYAIGAIPCLAAFAISIRNSDKTLKGITASQIVAGSIAIGTFVVALFSPLYSIYTISLYYLCTYYIFSSSLVAGRTTEDWLPWVIWSISAAINLFVGYRTDAGMAMVLPLTSLICWLAIACLAVSRR